MQGKRSCCLNRTNVAKVPEMVDGRRSISWNPRLHEKKRRYVDTFVYVLRITPLARVCIQKVSRMSCHTGPGMSLARSTNKEPKALNRRRVTSDLRPEKSWFVYVSISLDPAYWAASIRHGSREKATARLLRGHARLFRYLVPHVHGHLD